MKVLLRKHAFLILLAGVAGTPSFAQVEGTMPFMSSLPQVSYYNPAFKPQYKFSIGLPGSSVFVQFANNGFSYNAVVKKENNVPVADLDAFYASLAKKNYLNTNVHMDLFRVSLKANARLYLTFNATAKTYASIMLPKDLFGIFIGGTSQYVNSTASVSPKAELMSYVEIGTGVAYTVNKDLTVGARIKFLKGIVNATTQTATFDISLSDDYAITLEGDADIRTSGIQNLGDEDFDPSDDWRDFTRNNGLAIDIGATYRVTDRITVAASFIDIGGIKWKNNTYGYRIDPEQARYTFAGIDLNQMLDDDDGYLDGLADSLQAKFEPEEGSIAAYRTPLPGKLYLSGTYRIRRNFTAGALFFAEKFRGRFMPGFTASLNKEFGRRLGTSLTYTITNNAYNNIGVGISFNFAPVQLYFVGDNLLRIPIALATDKNLNGYVNNLQYFSFRTGLNFVFGRAKTQEKQSYPNTRRE